MALRKKQNKKKDKPISKRRFVHLVDNMVKRHGKVRIISMEMNSYNSPICDCLCEKCRSKAEIDLEMRKRQIDSKGNCKVAYNSEGYKSWSRFTNSCFMDNYIGDSCHCDACFSYECTCDGVQKTVKKTLKYMLDHDDDGDLTPIAIEYGKRFSKKMSIKLK